MPIIAQSDGFVINRLGRLVVSSRKGVAARKPGASIYASDNGISFWEVSEAGILLVGRDAIQRDSAIYIAHRQEGVIRAKRYAAFTARQAG